MINVDCTVEVFVFSAAGQLYFSFVSFSEKFLVNLASCVALRIHNFIHLIL